MAVLATAQQNSRSAERSSKESLVPEPSTKLQLPRQDAPSQFQPIPSYLPRQDPPQDFVVPSYYLAHQALPASTNSREDSYLPLPYSTEYSESAESLDAPPRDLVPPSAEPWNPSDDKTLYFIIPDVVTKQKTPTGYYPKKYNPGFEKQKPGVPKVELEFQPISSSELFHQLNHQLKQNLRQQKIQDQKRQPEKVKDFRERPVSTKRKKSKGRPKPPGDAQGAATTQFDSAEAAFGDSFQEESSNGERIDFQMHGYNGPLSYKWGYDTGKGPNRKFHYEERDNEGHVKGRYGYHDQHGKIRTVHYEADPHEGFHAEGNFENNELLKK